MFDAFGKPRAVDVKTLLSAKLQNAQLSRNGFTDHRHLDEIELIHMNGRAYDYNLGRFLSVDPIIQAPGNSQSLNPYSYIMNNPLAGTDPTGYCSKELGSNICSKEPSSVQVSAMLAGNMMAKAAQAAVDGSGAPQSAPNVQVSPKTSVVDIGNQQSTANNSGGDQHSKMETSDGWSYKGKTNDVDTYGKIYNRQDILNSIDDSGSLNLISEFTLPWDAATCLQNGCGAAEAVWATAMMIPLARSAKSLDGLSDVTKGRLRIDSGDFSQSEVDAAWHMASQGKIVHLRQPVGTRAGGGTSDMLVDGVRYDVYTPTSGNPSRIISAMAKKNSQTEGIVLDLRNSSVTADQLGNALGRVNGAGATNIKDIVIMGN